MKEHKRIFKEAAKERFKDAEVLYINGRVHSAFYLLGYCIECTTKYFIIKFLGCDNIKEAEDKVGELYCHIDKVENRQPILYRRIKLLKSQIIRINPRISRNKNFDPICNKLCQLIGEFYGTYGWRTQLRYSSEYSFKYNSYPPGYNFNYVKSDFETIRKKVGGIICHL